MLEIPPLPANTILLVEVGSTAHGTGIPGGEDHDELGVVVESPDEVVGLDEHGFTTVMQRTQPEGSRSGPGDIDRTLHSLRRFVRLAASGNPSILMTFWAPIEHITPEGEELRALGDAFVGAHVIPRYRGYMQAQAMRLLGLRGGGHGSRGGGGRVELIEAFGYDTKYAMHCARLGFQCLELLETGRLNLPIQGERLADLARRREASTARPSRDDCHGARRRGSADRAAQAGPPAARAAAAFAALDVPLSWRSQATSGPGVGRPARSSSSRSSSSSAWRPRSSTS
jgi:hypothetical protein